jgi:hypothetical protein
MSENKIGKYLKYAIGEIILVVIGILIALSINNWNETRKIKSTLSDYTESLIKDFKKDTLILNEQIKFAVLDNEILDNLIERLSQSSANNDTLLKIARHELPTIFKYFRPLNTNTMLAMQSNGTIEYFDETTYNYLTELQTLQKINGTIMQKQIDNHILQFQTFNSKYILNEYKAISGPLSDQAWENVDYNDLYRKVESYIATRKRMNDAGNIGKKELIDLTEKVLTRLIQISDLK